MDVLIRAGVNEHTNRYVGYQGEVVGVSGQFLAVHMTYDPIGNRVAPGRLVFYEPLELESPVDWAKYRSLRK